MDKCARGERASDLFYEIKKIRDDLVVLQNGSTDQTKQLSVLRAKMGCIEHQISILRLAQGEDRLGQYLWRAVFGIIGAGIGLLFTLFLRQTRRNSV
jgi:hypothetical protein